MSGVLAAEVRQGATEKEQSMRKRIRETILLCGLTALMLCPATYAQTTGAAPASARAWRFDVAPFYLWLPALEGDVTVRGNEASVDVSVGDFVETLFDSLEVAVTGRFEARKSNLILTFDLMYMSFAEDGTAPRGTDVEVDFSQLLLEFGAGYRLGEWRLGSQARPSLALEVLGGARYVYMHGELDIAGSGPLGLRLEVDGDVDWIEPFLGGRATLAFSKKLAFVVRGDIGGFGIGSDFTWALIGALHYHVSRVVSLVAAYRVLDIDYDEGSGASRFEYDVLSHGPAFGVVLHF
jgi:hypothetical protein